MIIKVYYHSRTGNTAKIADTIAAELGVQAEAITDQSAVACADLLLVGDGIYGGKPDSITGRFIHTMAGCNVRYAAVFGTYGVQGKHIAAMKADLEKQGVLTFDETFSWKSKFLGFINRKHPDEKDLQAARQFARWAVDFVKKQSPVD